MKLKVVLSSIIVGIIGWSSLHIYTSKLQQMQSGNNVLKTLLPSSQQLKNYGVIERLGVSVKANTPVAKRLQTRFFKAPDRLTENNNAEILIPKNSLVAKNSNFTNYIIPIVNANQNSLALGNGAMSTAPVGDGGGGGGSTIPIVDSVHEGASSNTIIYISVYGNNNVMSCNVVKTPYNVNTTNGLYNNSGETPTGVTNCTTIFNGNNSVDGPDNLLIDNNNLYVANSGNSSVTSCNLSKSGGIDTCNSFTVSIEPVYITQAAQNQLYIYSWPNPANLALAVSCVTDNNGNIINCGNPTKINVALLPYPIINNYTYTTNFNNNGINKCSGTNCQILNNILMQGLSNGPTAVVATSNNVYIVNYNSLVGCGIDKNSGNFFNCKVLNSNLNDAEGVAIYNVTSGS